ncbi:hypothetical protein [Legionella hackeliae]|uniref:Uncharacterized protein n=1 Tax=Legionella hackeliae TaxID=449 RepID=A0A0A8UXS3_LEGHA|nr:hypothetical protein [Legionella hackeliae]KTD13145.1 hypothetical protein Lhac_1014 [Legionella hackeliae]CEK11544.1 protein of unknown function [Legionella hackeliae]STX48315.1 Uncharacterised protein [Legionella hackeliae]
MPKGAEKKVKEKKHSSPKQEHQSQEVVTEKSHVVTFVKYFGEGWDHSATYFGKSNEVSKENYFSVYPQKEAMPSIGDPDDGIATVRMIMLNMKRMLYTNIHHEDPCELQQFPHEKVEVEVSKEEFDKAFQMAQKERKKAIKKEAKYSVFYFEGSTYSCAGHQHRILDIIATPDEKKLFKPTGKIWPTHTFENAKQVAQCRKKSLSRAAQEMSLPHEESVETKKALPKFSLFNSVSNLASLLSKAQNEKRERYGIPIGKI